ncbi:hypothetical protein [Mahella sp.]|uniref:hypothetical protein n=1 Tax=Mahella sp. TaxID=2798721 RepID=UPI0025BA1720|nr:hypothetical protein [Mahella sp.]MBZ4666173.1 hypothetical protein [Mahella sp.]
MMKKRLWIFILFLAFLLIIVTIIIASNKKQEPGITVLYSEETDQITVYATRPSNKNEPYEYENRLSGKEIVSLSSRYTKDSTDIFVFDILGNGTSELAFFSIDPQDASNKYKFAYELKIVVTDNAVNLNNILWRRKLMIDR